jgi:hypothetical protein
MVHVKLRGNRKKDEEVDVRVINQGGVNIGMEFEIGESLGQRSEGEIRRVV